MSYCKFFERSSASRITDLLNTILPSAPLRSSNNNCANARGMCFGSISRTEPCLSCPNRSGDICSYLGQKFPQYCCMTDIATKLPDLSLCRSLKRTPTAYRNWLLQLLYPPRYSLLSCIVQQHECIVVG